MGIWVTDAMLLQAVERYQRGVVASCRRISSHAGPLESRRRATRRHMTGLMPTSHPYPPIWQFDVGPNSLQWEAPTTQQHRRQKREQISVSNMFNSLIGWLENVGSADRPFISPPSQRFEAGAVSAEALAINPVVEAVEVSDPILQEPASSQYLPEEVIKLRSSISSFDIVDNKTLFKLTKTCRQSLRRRVEHGDLSVEALLAALEPLDSASKSRILTAETAGKMRAMIRRSILYAMVDTEKQTPRSISPDLWLAFVGRVCASNGDNHDIQLFWGLMAALPSSLGEQVPPEQIRNLASAFVTAQANRHNLFGHWSARAARFGQALESLNARQRQELDDGMITFLLQQDWISERARRMRFSWLVIKSYDSQTTTDEFIRTIHACCGKELQLHIVQLWQVLAARLGATGALDNEAHKQVLQDGYNTSMSQRWNSLVAAVMTSSRRNSALQELCTISTKTGQFDAVVRALTCKPVQLLRRDVMEALASACGNHEQALRLYDSIDLRRQPVRRRPLWGWSVWTKYVEQMIKDPNVHPIRVWQVLNLTSRRNGTTVEMKAKSQLLDQMGQWFVEAQHLTDRQVLRNVEKCVSLQRALTDGVTSQMLANLTDIITRDLDKGQRGRTSRMQWLLSMVAQNQGREQADRTASALNGWRAQIEPRGSEQL
ncbi:hypothetical protein MAC_05315 [Metarhizium acridum CQMa 102]|uniref:Fungal specific transcription factor domain containing protein n=2 Tax=Metarhizium acridum TaxID=92637 RepID=E9E617_METAQ|nr:uncharacterized protein MAC_05315 [Metarhizium acridum CQMa 102]EFY88697.1 hypothetical protein MAC_05315 [Metarhizium acridum CQMa 102]